MNANNFRILALNNKLKIELVNYNLKEEMEFHNMA